MNKSKKQIKVNARQSSKNVKVAKLDADVSESILPLDYTELIEQWGDDAQRLLKGKVNSAEEALAAFVEIVLSRSDLEGQALAEQREFLMDMLALDEEFKRELCKILRL